MSTIQRATLLPLLWLAGCAGYSPTVPTGEKPTPSDAYLYGRFQMVNTVRNVFTQNPQTMGFSFICADEKTYVVRFELTATVQVIKISPSSCKLTEFVYSAHTAIRVIRRPVPDSWKREVVFEAGKAYYIGDYQAESTQKGYPVITRTWQLRSARNNYARTTNELKATYPNLSPLPTEDRMIPQREQPNPSKRVPLEI